MSAANFQTISAGRRDLPDALARFRQDDGVRAIVLTDLASSAARTDSAADLTELIESLGKPVIAAVGGTTGGDACLLALACSFAVATGAARFALPLDYAGRDFALAFAGQLTVTSQLGSPPFQKLSAGEEVTAHEALSVGLVTQVVAVGDDLIEVCQSLARQVGEHAPLALRSATEAVTRGLRLPLEEALRGESRLFARCFSTEDAREGVRAFYEKRAPRFSGR
jgi:enoyl-CoA hydratase